MNLKLLHTLLGKDAEERLNTSLGLWIKNRYNFMLYAKQSYTTVAKSIGPPSGKREKAYIEPAPQVYTAMVENLYRIAEVLGKEEKASETLKKAGIGQKVSQFRKIIENLRALAQKQEDNGLDKEDYAYLNDLDRSFVKVISATDHPVVVDVHTEPNSKMVLEEATGYPFEVVFQELRGARFNCYEFKHPMDQRLTDESWQKMLKEGKAEGSLSETLLKVSSLPAKIVLCSL
jgi:hypothetical protein